jgi:large subunit ribosomal protein L21
LYAVIRAGGKQHKVSKGDVIEIERVRVSSDELRFRPLLVVDDNGKARSRRAELESATVTGRVLGETKGPKVEVLKYRSKTRYRRHTGHRQRYTSVEISDIDLGSSKARTKQGARNGA